MSPAATDLEVHAATADRWDDLADLLGPQGAYMGCWCAFWRLRHKDFRATSAAEHRALLEERVTSGSPPGLLAYRDGVPVGWISLEPRERFEALAHARVYGPVDDVPVWTVTCFYVREGHRGTGVMGALLEAAKVHVRAAGGVAVEGYPQEPADISASGTPGYMGLVSAFEGAGYREVARLSNGRPVHRARLDG